MSGILADTSTPGTVIAGIPVQHVADADFKTPVDIVPKWAGSRVTDEPLILRHRAGSTDAGGLRLIVSAPLPNGDYYLDANEDLAIRFPGHAASDSRPQLLRTVRRGYEYELVYEAATDASVLPAHWHRTLFNWILPLRGRGLAVHATGLTLPCGCGVICPGVSGTGKSTLARTLASGVPSEVKILSDDRIAVTRDDGELRLWGTPWESSARMSQALDVPCSGMVFVRHGPGAKLTALAPSTAMRRLLRTVAVPFWDVVGTEFAIEFVDRMVSTLPAFEFTYAPSADAARALVTGLRSAIGC